MLVLSRRLNEKIVFPGTDISVMVVALRGGAVRLGIEAPSDVRVLRGELPDRAKEWGDAAAQPQIRVPEADLRQTNRILRNRLRAGRADLQLLRRQLRLGLVREAEETLDKMQQDFDLVRQGR